jgi:hypothetical protein
LEIKKKLIKMEESQEQPTATQQEAGEIKEANAQNPLKIYLGNSLKESDF